MNAVVGAASIRTVELDFQTGAIERGLWVCLVQFVQRSAGDIENDSSCPESLRVLADLLAVPADEGPCRLTRNSQPNQTSLVVCPEYAFGSSDWPRIDELVLNFPRNLILVATFGASPLTAIGCIEEAGTLTGTHVIRGWTSELTGDRPINFGAVWVKSGARRWCVLFGKAFPEQRTEAPYLAIVEFSETTEIRFRDLRLIPAICADLVRNPVPGGGETAVQRIASLALQAPILPTLCTASVLQANRQASRRWQEAIDGLLSALGGANAVLIVCNVATESPDARVGGDIWRNLSGVYVSTQFAENGQSKDQQGSAYLSATHAMGWPLRSWLAHLIVGTAKFPPYDVAHGLQPWSDYSRYGLGTSLPPYRRSPAEDDLYLYCYVSGVGAEANYNLLQDALAHLESGNHPSSLFLVAQFLQGPLSEAVSVTYLPRHASNLKECLRGANALVETGRMHAHPRTIAWQSQPTRLGQLTLGTSSLALWSSGTKRQDEMLADLRDALVARPPAELLVVFGRGTDGDFIAETWKDMCLDRTVATRAEGFADLPVDAPVPLENALLATSFAYIARLIQSVATPNDADNLPAFNAVIACCEGTT